ncbi:P68 family surface lipoprotein [Mycoplasmopsis primatum]|uniref:P68 family surface lipoprotein n=1 Tax=Mycoplasmopsis primatum TaxID=55604 RepID=UPI000495B2E5|nr:P80 family lipoprotein [Mycoplasmopsis primatum]
MNKKKIFLMGAAAAVLPTTLMAASCGSKNENSGNGNSGNGNSGNENSGNKKITLGVTFTKGKPQWNAFQNLVNYYNSKFVGQKHFIPVEIENIGSGYDAGAQKILSDLNSKNKNTPNLTLNYAPVASSIASSEVSTKYSGKTKILNFEDTKNPDISVNLNNFDEAFTNQNRTTENLPVKGTFIIPVSKSIVATGANAPVIKYLLDKMSSVSKPAKIDDEFKKTQFYKDVQENGKSDEAAVAKKWGAVKTDADFSSLTINNDTFTYFEKFLEFADLAQKGFENSSKPNSNVHVLGVDDPSSLTQYIPYSMIGGTFDNNDFFIRLTSKNGKSFVDYNQIKDTNNEGYKALNKVFDRFKTSFQSQSLAILGDGEYTSTYQVRHEYAFAIGSSAGYNHNFLSDKKSTTFYSIRNTDFENEIGKSIYYAFSKNGSLMFNDGKHDNKIVKSDGEASGYDYQSLNKESDKKIADVLAKAGDKKSLDSLIVTLDKESHANIIKQIKELNNNKITEIGEFKKGKTTHILFHINDKSLINETKSSGETTLQEKEFLSLETISKWNNDAKSKFVTYLQGPSLIGISVNEEQDNAARKFVKFLTSPGKYDIDEEHKNYTVSEYISKVASYIFPSKGFEKTDTKGLTNKYIVQTYAQLKKIAESPDTHVAYEEPGSFNASEFRNALGKSFKNTYISIKNSQIVGDFNAQIIKQIETLCNDFIK